MADFGLARFTERGEMTTQSSGVVGTLAYMAPEQFDGRREEIGPRSDVYSLGLIFFELLTGHHPFQASNFWGMFDRMRLGSPDPIAKVLAVPSPLREICQRCLEAEPEQRYGSASELHGDLKDYLSGDPISNHKRRRGRRLLRWSQRPQRITQAASACLVGNLAVLQGLVGAPLLKLNAANPIPGTMQELVWDISKLVVFPHLPMLFFSVLVLRGRFRWQWGNLVFSICMLALVSGTFASGRSPVRAYDSEPLSFLLVHLIILGIAISMLAMQLVALPALLKEHRHGYGRIPS